MPIHKHMILFGAGASVPIGLPTMTKLTTDFENSIKDNTKELQLLTNAKHKILLNGFYYDAESLYTYLIGCGDPLKSIRDSGPYVASKCRTQPIRKIRKSIAYSKMREKLEEHVIKSCYLGEEYERRRTIALFDRLFAKVSGVENWENETADWDNTIFDLFSTNWDNAIELYGREKGIVPFVGHQTGADGRVSFRPKQYDETDAKIRLYKLHGSIELSMLEDDTIASIEPPGIPGKKHKGTGKKIKGKIMVYGPNKNIIADPYFEKLIRLKKCLTETYECTVVGYSFRDPWIYQIFSDVAKNRRQRNPWIEYVSPHASNNISKFPKLERYVNPIDQSLEQYLKLPTGDCE